MKVVYIAGPFMASSAWEIEQNCRRAEMIALNVWRAGAVAVCPHAMTRHYVGTLPERTWLDGGLELLRRCDAVVLADGWRTSHGAKEEAREAARIAIEIFCAKPDGSLPALFCRWLDDYEKTKFSNRED